MGYGERQGRLKRVLVTGARAPSALEVMRRLAGADFEIYAADCLHFPPGRFSRHVRSYLRHPSPRHDLAGYAQALEDFIQKNKIDLVFPTCEEVFYLSFLKPRLEKSCRVFCEDFPRMSALHNKAEFQDIARQHGMGFIETRVIDVAAQAESVIESLLPEKKYVIKPVFSRFGDKAVVNIRREEIRQNLKPLLYPWAVQEFIPGQEYCTYALCREGAVIAEACYAPHFKAGQGSSVYFLPVRHADISRQVRSLVSGVRYNGQIGFDFMVREDGRVFVLECNPRATSGVHLLPQDIDWSRLLDSSENATLPAPATAEMSGPKMVGLAMLVYGLRHPNTATFPQFLRAYRQARDVVGGHRDWLPFSGQAVSLLEILWRSHRSGQNLKDASTADIEWDGQAIG